MPYPHGALNGIVTRPGIYKLTIELVPENAWGSNLRSELTETAWDELRRRVYEAAGHRCEICGGRGRRHPVECHERWQYRENERLMRLSGLLALCPLCHGAKHWGFSLRAGRGDEILAHMAKVNGTRLEEMEAYAKEALEGQSRRASMIWTLDLEWLKAAHPDLAERRRKAPAKPQFKPKALPPIYRPPPKLSDLS